VGGFQACECECVSKKEALEGGAKKEALEAGVEAGARSRRKCHQKKEFRRGLRMF
jgi:hypothetical protein